MKKTNRHLVFRFIIIFLTLVSIDSVAAGAKYNSISTLSRSVYLRHWEIVKDTSPKETLQNIPDSLWKLLTLFSEFERYSEGNWLIRTNIEVKDSVNQETVWGLFPINFITSYEIYWDGMKIAQNGIIGIDKSNEKAGLYNFNLLMPPHLVTKGKHTIILRISNYSNYTSWRWFYGDVLIGPYDTELKNIYLSRYRTIFITGILLIPFLFNLFLYIARKRKTEHLLFSLICLIVILDSVTSLVPVFTDAPTTFIHWEYYAYKIITILFTVLFPAFFIYLFSFSKKIIGVILLVNLIIFFFFTNLGNVFNIMSLTVLIISSMISVWALVIRREGSIIIFIGLILAWGGYIINFAFAGLATVMVLCTSLSIAIQFARKEKSEREAQLRSARLENELLKKNINPHFLLNTLTSIIVWLRKDPKSAIKLIETLAEEFRMIMQISPLEQIPIRQEIDLCKAHLKIMNYRKGADYKMETVDIAEEENVPPMIFHTLIENGLTHGYENKLEGTFTLQRRKNSNSVQYLLSNDGDFSQQGSKNSTGFGLRYIKSRLEESYPGRWEIKSQMQEQGWETIIEIKEK